MKKLLIVVDYQKDFVSGSLGFAKAVELEDSIYQKIKDYKDRNDDVIFTFDTHGHEYLNTKEGKKLPVEHCVKGEDGWSLYGKVAELYSEEDLGFEKSAFGSLKLADYLRDKDYDFIEIVGVVSNICVISNAVIAKTALPEADIVVDASCTASADEELHEKALDVMEGLQIEVTNRK